MLPTGGASSLPQYPQSGTGLWTVALQAVNDPGCWISTSHDIQQFSRHRCGLSARPLAFLPRYATHKRGTGRRPVSVRPSVTIVYCIETDKDISQLFLCLVAPPLLVFFSSSAVT